MSLSTAEKSLGAEGNLHSAKDPVSAESELRAGVAANEVEPETSMQTGAAGSETDVMLPSDGRNGAMHTGMERVANNDALLLDSPVWPMYDPNCRRVSEMEDGQDPICNGDGKLLFDEDGNCMYEDPGWRVLRDQSGRCAGIAMGSSALNRLTKTDWR